MPSPPPTDPADAPNPEPLALSPGEWQVMKVLWDRGQAAARDVHAALPETGWSDRTVKTMLSRLVAKGALDYEQIGNSYLYRPAIERMAATREEVRGIVRRVTGETLSPLLAAFVDEAAVSDGELDELQRMIDAKRAERTAEAKGKQAKPARKTAKKSAKKAAEKSPKRGRRGTK